MIDAPAQALIAGFVRVVDPTGAKLKLLGVGVGVPVILNLR